jgi:hypothetical protein
VRASAGATVTTAAGPAGLPLACPVTMSPLDTTGTSSASKLTYKLADEGFWDMTIGAGVEESGPKPPASVQEAVRTLLPAQLRGFLPQGSTFGTTTFELPSVAFAYERGWRQVRVAVGVCACVGVYCNAPRVYRWRGSHVQCLYRRRALSLGLCWVCFGLARHRFIVGLCDISQTPTAPLGHSPVPLHPRIHL